MEAWIPADFKDVVTWMRRPRMAASVACTEYDVTRRCFVMSDKVALIGLSASAGLEHAIAWDVFASIPVGGEIIVIDDLATTAEHLFEQTYYRDCVEVAKINDSPLVKRVRKIALGGAEVDRGLTEWSFAIPVGSVDRSRLRAIYDRIEAMGFEAFELLIACTEAQGNAIADFARVIPTAPKATLTAKKNALVAAAKHPNLCILHDRIDLPTNFRYAVERYGDFFPFVAVQSLVNDPISNGIRRYSDYHSYFSDAFDFFAVGNDMAGVLARNSEIMRVWRSYYAISSPFVSSNSTYATGTMYICKRAVWAQCPQAELLDWNDLEDFEQGLRANRTFGIPTVVNAHMFTRTVRARGVMLGVQSIQSVTERANTQHSAVLPPRASSDFKIDLIRRPATVGRRAMIEFACDYVPASAHQHIVQIIRESRISSVLDLLLVCSRLLYASAIVASADFIREFVERFFLIFNVGVHDGASVDRLTDSIASGSFHVDVLLGSSEFDRVLDLVEAKVVFNESEPLDLFDEAVAIWPLVGTELAFSGDFSGFVDALYAAFGDE